MTTRTAHLLGGSAAFLFCGVGPRPTLDTPDRGGATAILDRINATHTETKGMFEAADGRMAGVEERLTTLEQRSAKRGGRGGGDPEDQSVGSRFMASDSVKAFVANGFRGHARMEVKTIISASTSAGPLIPRDNRPDPVMLPKRTFIMRRLVPAAPTSSNQVHYIQHTSRVNNASTVTEKSGKRRREAIVPLYDELRSLLGRIPKRATTILTNSRNRP